MRFSGSRRVWASGAPVFALWAAGVACTSAEPEKGKYASVLSGSWEGKSLHLEGVSGIPCVKFSQAQGGCTVFHRKADATIERFTGRCSLEGGAAGTYLSLNCENNGTSCVPGDNRILINMNTAQKVDGTEHQVVDSNLKRRITVLPGTCEQDVESSVAPGVSGGQLLRAADVVPSAPAAATLTQTFNATWNGHALEFDSGTVRNCLNFVTLARGCTMFTKYKSSGNVRGPESGSCSIGADSEGKVLTVKLGSSVVSSIALAHPATGSEQTFADKSGTRFWKIRTQPCLSANF